MKIKDEQSGTTQSNFDEWWGKEALWLLSLIGTIREEHVKRIARIAWENGKYKEKHRKES